MISHENDSRPGPPLTEEERRFWSEFHGSLEEVERTTRELVEDVGHIDPDEFLPGHASQGQGE
jgi:hypothetical protein